MYDNKRDNIVQITIRGISTFNEKYRSLELKEHFRNPIDNYAYNIHTYIVQSQQFKNYAISTIELHDNLLRKGTLDKEQFYSNVSYINKIRDYFVYSESFVKYLSNTSVNCKIGKALIVEFARCDQNMGELLKSLGYQEKEMILKKGHIIRYRNYPIIAITSDKYEELEVVGYCEESNKSKLEEIMINIKNQLSQSYNFEDKSK